jgi:hypothetical protein
MNMIIVMAGCRGWKNDCPCADLRHHHFGYCDADSGYWMDWIYLQEEMKMDKNQVMIQIAAEGMSHCLLAGASIEGSQLEKSTFAKLLHEFADIIEQGEMKEDYLNTMIAFVQAKKAMLGVS